MPSDPYRNYKYEVEVDGFTRAGFSKVSGLTESTEDIEYREGGENETPHHLPGQTKFDPIVLSQGVSTDSDFINWRNLIYDVDQTDGAQGGEDYRKTIVIYLKDKAGNRVAKWTVHRGWPTELATEDLDAMGNDVLIQSLTITNEGQKHSKL